MADTTEAAPESNVNTKCSDSIFLMECLKNLNSPANVSSSTKSAIMSFYDYAVPDPQVADTWKFQVDINAVATALGYGNPNSAANRVRSLKKKFNLQITPVSGSGVLNGTPAIDDGATGTPKPTPASPKTPRKGAKAARGPAKAKAPPADGEEASPATTPAKRGRKPGSGAGRKPKAAVNATEATKGPDAGDNSAGSPDTAEPQNTQATENPAGEDNAATA